MSDFFDELEAEASEAPETKGRLDEIQGMGAEVSKLNREIEKLETDLSERKTRRYKLTNEQMPATMDESKVPTITVDGFVFKCETKYKANIAADDPPEKRDAAFDWLNEVGGGDVINNVVTVVFPKEMNEDAQELLVELRRRFDNRPEVEVVRERKVPWNRLSSWLRDYVETPPVKGKKKLPVPLELLNATIGRIVTVKPAKD